MLNTLAALATCVIVIPTDHPTISEHVAYVHELAHCNGFEHGPRGPIVPPRRFVHKPKMPIEVMRLPTAIAENVCSAYGGDSFACQFFE